MIDDKTLITRVVSRDDHYAFSCLVNKYQSRIRQLLRRLTAGDHHLADDLAQETFITLYRKLNTYKGDASLNTWLHKIAYNHFYKSLDKSFQKHEHVEFDALTHKAPDSALEADIAIEQLMTSLSVPERTCLTLSVSAGMSHQEVANITKFPLGTVKSHINRAKQKLLEQTRQQAS